jgi:hypothetical protein
VCGTGCSTGHRSTAFETTRYGSSAPLISTYEVFRS